MIDRDFFSDLGIPFDYAVHPLRRRYLAPRELEDVEPNIVGRMQTLAPDTAQAWRRMKADAARANVVLLLVSGYRSESSQADLIRRKLAAGQSIEAILEVNAAPGFSEHHTGRALDIATPGARPLTVEFDASAAFRWLATNAARYGFRMPYGKGNPYGLGYEPWHWSQLPPERPE